MTEFQVQHTSHCRPTAKIKNEQDIKVRCLCRMPRMALEPMIACSQCKEWQHDDNCPKNAKECSTK